MSSETIFFSYSRTDSAFVLKLAKDLRDSGAELWLDQLDIKPGEHWDSSIQAALNTSQILIVILSPASVDSTNVMDEVSFALEKEKRVIPVLLKECTPPYRLMRLQRIDFTGDYKSSLVKLFEVLGYDSAGKTTDQADENEVIPKEDTNDNSENKKLPVDDSDKVLWEEAKNTNTISSYKKYLSKISDGKHKDEALEKIKILTENPSNKKGNFKKYIFIAGGIIITLVVAWVIMQSAQKAKIEAGKEKLRQDSIVTANTIRSEAIKDSIYKERQKAIADSIYRVEHIGLGKKFEGGIIFYIDKTGQHGLIMAQGDQTPNPISWFDGPIVKAGAFDTEIYDGKRNTEKIVKKLGDGKYPAKICYDLELEGKTDWYLPSQKELDELYKYNNHEGFSDRYYWSSTEVSGKDVYYKSFYNGQAYVRFGSNKAKVRAIRAF